MGPDSNAGQGSSDPGHREKLRGPGSQVSAQDPACSSLGVFPFEGAGMGLGVSGTWALPQALSCPLL